MLDVYVGKTPAVPGKHGNHGALVARYVVGDEGHDVTIPFPSEDGSERDRVFQRLLDSYLGFVIGWKVIDFKRLRHVGVVGLDDVEMGTLERVRDLN